jgi:hypothetical protein
VIISYFFIHDLFKIDLKATSPPLTGLPDLPDDLSGGPGWHGGEKELAALP